MDFVTDLRTKAARERAWLIGDQNWMRQWLLERASAAHGSKLETKSQFGATCLAIAAAHAPDLVRKAISLHYLTEPRVPRGSGEESGRWTRLAGDVPGLGHNQGPPLDEKPKIPSRRPDKSEHRTESVKRALRFLRLRGAGALLSLIQASPWLAEYQADILAAHVAPDTLENLQADGSKPAAGYERHHIVEQTPAEKDGFSRAQIDSPENLVRIPRIIHRDISAWYSTGNPDYGGNSPRDYLRGKTWEERRSVGLQALRLFGVLKP